MASRYKPHWSHEKIDETCCRASVPDPGIRCSDHQCQRTPPEGSEWCWQHSPEAEAERRAKSEAKYQAEVDGRAAKAKAPYNRCIFLLNSVKIELMDPDADEFRRRAIRLIEKERDKKWFI